MHPSFKCTLLASLSSLHLPECHALTTPHRILLHPLFGLPCFPAWGHLTPASMYLCLYTLAWTFCTCALYTP